MTRYSAPEGVDGRRVSAGDTVWGDACLAFQPTTWFYGAFDNTTVEVTVTTTTTVTYEGRVARHDQKRSSTTTVSPPAYRIATGETFCYTTTRPNPFRYKAPYPA